MQHSCGAISIIMPVYNEAACVVAQVQALLAVLQAGDELIVVDGGSVDPTWAVLQAEVLRYECNAVQVYTQNPTQSPLHPHSFRPVLRVLQGPKGRAAQMNAGAALAQHPLLWFVHADTRVTQLAVNVLRSRWQSLAQQDAQALMRVWGRFDVGIEGCSAWLPVVAFCINWRSRISQIATGDQGLFMHQEMFAAVGGFPQQPLMEDIELCKRLKSHGLRVHRGLAAQVMPVVFWPLRERVYTSGRRWEQHGVWRTIVLMWRMRYAYWRGVPADVLAAWYRDAR